MTTTTINSDSVTAPQGVTTIFVIDCDGAIISVSASGEQLTGKAPVDLQGVNISELLREREGVNLLHAIQKAADSGWTGGLGRHWLTPASMQDALVEVFIDPETMGHDQLLISL